MTNKQRENFYENHAYGTFFTKTGDAIPFNRRYKPLHDKGLWVEDIVRTEWYYTDGTPDKQRAHNSEKRLAVRVGDENINNGEQFLTELGIKQREKVYGKRLRSRNQ